ncbi:MAG: arginine--tRNA ligase [Firmicutes bacterium]|nr:arginine--tRNA ligase [Bacillota bacterium]
MKKIIIDVITNSLKHLNIDNEGVVEVEKPKIKDNGDFSSNIALKLTKILHESPMEIADKICENISDERIIKVEVKKPGFINFFVNKKYLIDNIDNVIKLNDLYGSSNIGNNIKYNIEFVSANPTGTLHLGNARGGAYGDSLARILKFSGFDVTTEYYINDAGNQIDNLGLSIKARYLEICGKEFKIPENGYHGKEIIDIAKKLYDEYKDSLIEKELEFFKEVGVENLLNAIITDLKEYRIEYDVFTSEKKIREQYNIDDLLNKMQENGYIYEKDGAKWFKCSALFDDKDHVLVKSDGEYTYLVSDIAYHLDKVNRGYDKMIDILGTDHHGYVARLKSSVQALGNDADKLDVKLLQLVRLVEDGQVVKMSKRTGKSVTLKELMDEVGVNATRYYFSRYSLDTQMDFNLTQAKTKSNENPVYYVTYAYARICSILKSYENEIIIDEYKSLNNELAYNVLEKVYEFPEVVKNAARKELPHLITQYTYDLASSFHLYYTQNRILTDDKEVTQENINLIKAVKITLNNALNLIGIIPPEKM